MDILETKNNENNENLSKNEQKSTKKHKILRGLAIFTALLGATSIVFGGLWLSSENEKNGYKNELENVYKSNFYSLLDNVNNLENKMSKVINSSSSIYQRKTLQEAAKNASEAEIAVASLPLSASDTQEMTKMVNQISGFTSTLADKLVTSDLDSSEYQTLREIHENVKNLQNELNEFERKMNRGYSIVDASGNINDGTNDFSLTLSSFKDNDVEYPSMIYDGPFSDSVTTSEVKGLKGEKISKTEALKNLEKYFKNASDVDFESETNGTFETYNYRVTNSEDEILFVQMTKIGGYVLTISGAGEKGSSNTPSEEAKEIALNFAKENGIKNPEVVWSDTIENSMYFNITPVENGIVLYPDLVKVKINLSSGTVVGYDATSYFTNHTERNIKKGSIKYSEVSGKIPSEFELLNNRIALAPLDYNREIVCIEIEANDGESTFYFYFNSTSGELENVLKVVKTDNGNLLM